jgi:tripartite-type tricarboxylate transporter receptor subunit TctC
LFYFPAGALLCVLATAAYAQQGYPSRPIRFVVPFAPGGGTDFVARLVAQKLGDRLGQQLIVDNRAGAGGAVGVNIVAKSPPDGYTLLLGQLSPLAISPLLEKLPYNPERDLVGATLLASSYHVLVIHPSLPARSVKQFIALARSRPGEILYGSSGPGTNLFLLSELFKTAAGIDIVHVPYKGTAPAALAVLSGETQMLFGGITGVNQFVSAGRLVALGVTSPARSPLLPKVPTLIESGLRGVDAASWYSLMAPAGTPREIVSRLHAEVAHLVATPDYRQQMEKQAFEPLATPPEQFPAFLRSELEKWARVIKTTGIKTD